MQKAKSAGHPADSQQEKKGKENEKDEELFVYIVPPNCEEKKWINIKFL